MRGAVIGQAQHHLCRGSGARAHHLRPSLQAGLQLLVALQAVCASGASAPPPPLPLPCLLLPYLPLPPGCRHLRYVCPFALCIPPCRLYMSLHFVARAYRVFVVNSFQLIPSKQFRRCQQSLRHVCTVPAGNIAASSVQPGPRKSWETDPVPSPFAIYLFLSRIQQMDMVARHYSF